MQVSQVSDRTRATRYVNIVQYALASMAQCWCDTLLHQQRIHSTTAVLVAIVARALQKPTMTEADKSPNLYGMVLSKQF